MNNPDICKTLAVVFPGQGSQSVGMLASLAEESEIIKHTFAEASEVLDYDLWERISNGPAELLNKTNCTQPAMLAAGVAVWRYWRQCSGMLPAIMAGHSLGEYTALVCAESLNFTEAVRLVEQRGEFMQNAVPDGVGAMAAILGLADEQVIAVCEQAAENEVVNAVNFNSPGQVVIAGNRAAVERAMDLAKQAGAKRALPLPVSVPSHCSLMMSAADALAKTLQSINVEAPGIPVLHNTDVACYENGADIRGALARQLYSPVRWVETIQKMSESGVTTVLEMGPGKVLAGLNKRIEKSQAVISLQTRDDIDKALEICQS